MTAMGLDGGTIATRSDLLRRSSWRLANHDDGAARSTRGGQLTAAGATTDAGLEGTSSRTAAIDGFSICALSGLRLPADGRDIVCCALGNLYSRNAVVEYLTRHGQFQEGQCDSTALDLAFGHIQRLRDVFSVQLTPNPFFGRAVASSSERLTTAGGDASSTRAPWICPVDRDVSTDGSHAFCALRPCGHVLREHVAHELARLDVGGLGRPGDRSGSGGSGGVGGAAASSSRAASEPNYAASGPSDGVSTIHGGAWVCPVCSAPVEVVVRLFAGAEADRLRDTLRDAREAGKNTKQGKKRARGTDASCSTSTLRQDADGRGHGRAEKHLGETC